MVLAKLAFEEVESEYQTQIDSTKRDIESMRHVLDKHASNLDAKTKKEYEDELTSLQKKLSEFEKYLFGRSGKVVWSATEDAVNATK